MPSIIEGVGVKNDTRRLLQRIVTLNTQQGRFEHFFTREPVNVVLNS